MKNTIKFISIGMVMVLLLMSQWSVNKSVEAATVADNDVEWMGNASNTIVTHIAPGSTTANAYFYINDADLKVTHSGVSTWTKVNNGNGAFAAGTATTNHLNLQTGTFNSAALNASNHTFAKTNADFIAGTTHLVQGSLYAQLAAANQTISGFNNSLGTLYLPAVTVVTTLSAHYDFHKTDIYTTATHRAKVTSTSDSNGEWVQISEVASAGVATVAIDSGIFRGAIAVGTDAQYATSGDSTVWVQDGDTLTVSYYEKIDADGNDGALIASTTATIDAQDPEITIVGPVDGELTDDLSPTLSFTISDSGSGFDADIVDYTGHIAVQVNGCDVTDASLSLTAHSSTEMTFTYTPLISEEYNDASTPNASCSTAQRTAGGFNVASAVGPYADNSSYLTTAITANNTTAFVVKNASHFTVGDILTIDAEDVEVSAINLTTNTLTVVRGHGTTTADATHAVGLEIGDTSEATYTRHGQTFSWKVTAEDEAGNTKVTTNSDMDIHIDSAAPTFTSGATAVTGATAWDTGTSADVADNSSIKLSFHESIDAATVSASDFVISGDGVTSTEIVSVSMGGTKANTDKYIYLDLAADLAPNAQPKVVLVGEISDYAGNALKPTTAELAATDAGKLIGTANDGVKPTLSSVTRDLALIDDGGEVAFTFESDENLTKTSETLGNGCTCGSVSGEGTGVATGKLAATLTDPNSGTATFKESNSSFDSSGIYGVTILGRDAAGMIGTVGGVKVTNEDQSAAVTAQVAANTDFSITLKNWPLADHDGDGTLADSITAATDDGVAITLQVDHRANTGTVESITAQSTTVIAAGSKLRITYYYVDAAQTVEVDKTAPAAPTYSPADGATTEDSTPSFSVTYTDDEFPGDGNTTVTLTKAELEDPDGTVIDVLSSMTTSDDKSFYYKPGSALALGDWTLTTKAEDVNGNASAETSAKLTIKELSDTEITMVPGWNLISLPGEPTDNAINSVITNLQVLTVLTYDPNVPGGWLTAVRDGDSLVGTLTTIDSSHAYWVQQNNSDKIEVAIPGFSGGVAAAPPSISLVAGWNLVPAINNSSDTAMDQDDYFTGLDWARAKGWNANTEAWIDILPDTANTTQTIAKKSGYWVYLNKAGTLVP